MHIMCSDRRFPNKCPIPNCQSSFEYEKDLKRHIAIHNNDFDVCQYCPYRYNYTGNYIRHLKKHFRIKDFKCDQCDKEFATVGDLNIHYAVHEGLIYGCRICKIYNGPTKRAICEHLRRKHVDVVGRNVNWDAIQKFITKK